MITALLRGGVRSGARTFAAIARSATPLSQRVASLPVARLRALTPVRVPSSRGFASSSSGPPLFDTYQLVEKLHENGFSKEQSKAVMDALISATHETHSKANSKFGSKEELGIVKTQFGEKLFNAQLKNDSELKHLRELMQADINAIKSDLESLNRNREVDRGIIRSEIETNMLKLEKKIEMQNVELEGFAEKFENRLIKGSIAFFFSFVALVLTYLRFFGSPQGATDAAKNVMIRAEAKRLVREEEKEAKKAEEEQAAAACATSSFSKGSKSGNENGNARIDQGKRQDEGELDLKDGASS